MAIGICSEAPADALATTPAALNQLRGRSTRPSTPAAYSERIAWPKLNGSSIPSSITTNGRSRPAYTPPTTPIETELQKIWEELLGLSPIGVHDDFFTLGGESWQAISFLSKFEAATGYYLPLGTLLSASTIAGLAQSIDKADPPEAIIEIQPGSPGIAPLFLIPGAAGNTLAIQRIGQHLAASQPVYTFQMPNLNGRDLTNVQVKDLAPYYLQAMQRVQPHGPYHLGGYSAGGILAYEVAQRLQAQGETVDFLVIIDMPAPDPALVHWWRLCHFLASLFHLPANREEGIFLLGRDCWSRTVYFWRREIGRASCRERV